MKIQDQNHSIRRRLVVAIAGASAALVLGACVPLKGAPPPAAPPAAPAGPTGPAAPSTPDLDAASDSGSSTTDNLTKDRTPTLTGTAEDGSTVKLFDGATQVGSGNATGGNYSITPASNLSSGTHAITATATNAIGTSPASGALSVVIDFAPPTVNTPDLDATQDSGFSSSDNITNVTNPAFSGFTEAGVSVELFDGATSVGTGPAPGVAFGTYSITPTTSPLSDGVHAMSAKATDAAGNVGPSSLTLNVTIDTVAAVEVTQPDPGQDFNPGSVVILGTAADSFVSGNPSLVVEVKVYSGATATGTPLSTTQSSPLSGSWFTNTPSLGAGTYTVQANYTDYAGNTATSTAVTFTV